MSKILIIEDDKDLAEMIQVDLRKQGYDSEIAFDGEEGLEKSQTINPALIILDLKLPKLDGYRLCELLKLDDNYKDIPIIILTARGEDIEKKAGFAAGANEYLVKPYNPETLHKKIKEYIK